MKAVTSDAAYALRLEHEVGSIETGKLANFTVLSENPVTSDPLKIKDIAVWGTVQEGRVLPVKRSPGAAPAKQGSSAKSNSDLQQAMLQSLTHLLEHKH